MDNWTRTQRRLPIFLEETGVLLSIMMPTLVRYMAFQMADRATIAFVGTYDPLPAHIAGVVLAKMYSNITCLSLGIGVAFGISTFASQNFGSESSHNNGLILRQARRAFAGAWAFALIAAAVSKPLLAFLGQPPEILWPCQQISLILAAGAPAAWLSFAMQSMLVAQRIVIPSMVCDGLAAISNLILAYLFLLNGVGYIGLAYATFISYWMSLAFSTFYILWTGRQATVWEVPEDLAEAGSVSFFRFLQTSLPSAFSMWVEWWAAELMSIMAGLLPAGEYSVGAHGLLFNTAAIFYMAFCANANASTTRIGNLIGSKETYRIRPLIASGIMLAMVIATAVSGLLYAYGSSIFLFYTHDAGLVEGAVDANMGMVLTMAPYSLMMLFLGVLRGADMQAWGAVNMFVAFYLLGLPLSGYLGFIRGMGLSGIWYGNAAGMGASALAMLLKVACIDWDHVSSIDEDLKAPLLKHAAGGQDATPGDLESSREGADGRPEALPSLLQSKLEGTDEASKQDRA